MEYYVFMKKSHEMVVNKIIPSNNSNNFVNKPKIELKEEKNDTNNMLKTRINEDKPTLNVDIIENKEVSDKNKEVPH